MTDLNPEVLHVLARLMTPDDDYADLSEEKIVETLLVLRQRQVIEGRAVAELHRRGWTWERIAREIGVAHFTTVQKWATQYRTDRPSSSSDPSKEGKP